MMPAGNPRVEDDGRRVTFTNGALTLAISRRAGEWLSFQAEGRELINHGCRPRVPADFKVAGAWMVQEHGARYLRHEVVGEGGSVTLNITLGVHLRPANPAIYTNLVPYPLIARSPEVRHLPAERRRYEYLLTCGYTLQAGSTELRRRITVTRTPDLDFLGTRAIRFESFLFLLPGVLVGDRRHCIVDQPGPVIPTGVLAPRLPYAKAKRSYVCKRPSPDFDLGIVVVSDPASGRTLSHHLETTETTYLHHLVGDGRSLTLAADEERPDWIYDTGTVCSHESVLRWGEGPVSGALREYGRYLAATFPLRTDVPAWVREAVFMEIDPRYYGGFEGIRDKLAGMRQTGFTAIYLLPINEGGYAVADHYRIDPALGDEAGFRAMVAEAHALGMKVLMDLLVSIMRRDSPAVRDHPEWFCRDEAGRPTAHPRWANVSTDYRSPGWRAYLVAFAEHCVRDLGVDGFRVDSTSAKAPNWHPHGDYAPWQTMLGAYDILDEVNRRIKAIKADAILLDEQGGPVSYRACDVGHNIGFIYQVVNQAVRGSGYTLADYKRYLQDVQDALQPGAPRVYYVRNHDTAWFYRFDGYSPAFFAYEAVHCLIRGIPLVFSGQLPGTQGHRPADGATWDGPPADAWDRYRRLFSLRAAEPALVHGECLFDAVDTDVPQVFSTVRRLDRDMLLVLVSGGADSTRVHVRLDGTRLGLPEGPGAWHDRYVDSRLRVESVRSFDVTLDPWAVAVLRFEPEGT